MSALLDLFVSFARTTLLGFGGGPSMIPLVRAEVVDSRGWLTAEEFLDAFAFGNSLPGPIVTKLAMYVGHDVAGWAGTVAALSGATLPTATLFLLVFRIVFRAKDSLWLRSILSGVRPVVVGLLLVVVWDFAPAALGSPFIGIAGPLKWGLAAVSLWATLRTNVHPVILIIGGAAIGVTLGLAA